MRVHLRPVLLIQALILVLCGQAQGTQPQLRQIDRVRLAEAFRMNDQLSDKVWPRWSKTPFAVLLITPEHEFLMRHPQPPKDFASMGYDPLLKSEIFFRPRTFNQNFLATFPINGVSTIVVGQAENTAAKNSTRWVVTLFHEHFHQMQDSQPNFYRDAEALQLTRGDQTGMWMLNFPFPYEKAEIKQGFAELSLALVNVLQSTKRELPMKLSTYLAARKRFQEMLDADDYKYFSFQLWKEGFARYTELRVAERAAASYKPTTEFTALADFTPFAQDAERTHRLIMSNLSDPRLGERQRISFYAFGAGEAMLLDRVRRSWKKKYFVEKFFPDKYFAD